MGPNIRICQEKIQHLIFLSTLLTATMSNEHTLLSIEIYLAQFQRMPSVTHDDERHGVTLDVAAVACEDAFIRHLVAEGRVVVIREHG